MPPPPSTTLSIPASRPTTPLLTITLFFASGRNQITANSKVVPAILAVINPILTTASIQHTAAFLGPNTGNITALATAERCPQCLASPFEIRQIDLHPLDVAPATGPTMVGMTFVGYSIAFEASHSHIHPTHNLHYSSLPSPSPSFKSSVRPA